MEAYLLAVGIVALIYLLLTLGLNLQYGFTGLINFGHVGFFAAGAYAAALPAVAGYPPILGMILAPMVGALLAWPIGLVALRLREDYLAIVTLGFSEVVRIVCQNESWLTKGVQGVPAIPRMFVGVGGGLLPDYAIFATLLAVNIVVILGIHRLVKSPFGRLIQAIRDDQDAVAALGKDPARYKIQVLMIGGALAGLAGAFYARYITFITPEQFVPLITFYVWMAMIMGGVGRTSGAVVGTLLLIGFLEGSRFLRDAFPSVPEVQMASVRLAVVGLALILFTLYRPNGMMGGARGKI